MAKTIQMRTTQQEKEARLVAGMYDKNRKIQSELYAYCSKYFWANYRGVFFADEESATEIFHIHSNVGEYRAQEDLRERRQSDGQEQ